MLKGFPMRTLEDPLHIQKVNEEKKKEIPSGAKIS